MASDTTRGRGLTLMNIGKFDYVICFGVLYHLRHLLLGMDMLYATTREACFIETAFGDSLLPRRLHQHSVWLLARPHLYNPNDHSNWFLPTLFGYRNALESCGFVPTLCKVWPKDRPHRCTFKCTPKAKHEWGDK